MVCEHPDSKHEWQVGVDEAGRGCLLGPVFSACVLWDPDIPCHDINDSKKLSVNKRKEMRLYIETHAIAYGIGVSSTEEIDSCNILQATFKAMHRAIDIVVSCNDVHHILVDGDRFLPYPDIKHTCVTRGDQMYTNIAAASILAKEHHDEWIRTHYVDDREYGLLNNKGYGTLQHRNGIIQHGLTTHHRKTFCKNIKSMKS